MKKCQNCGHGNSDEMRFCLECGASLPNAPMVVNISGSTAPGQNQPGPSTNPYGQSAETKFGEKPFQQNYSMIPPSRPRSNKKIFIALGGIVSLILLVLVAGAAIIGYNLLKKPAVVYNQTPTPTPIVATPTGTPKPTA